MGDQKHPTDHTVLMCFGGVLQNGVEMSHHKLHQKGKFYIGFEKKLKYYKLKDKAFSLGISL